MLGSLTSIDENVVTAFYSNLPWRDGPEPISPSCSISLSDCTNSAWFTSPYFLCTSRTSEVCGACTIYPARVRLLYFPEANYSAPVCRHNTANATECPLGPTTHSITNTDLFNQQCLYATNISTSTVNSGPYAVVNGSTFYQNRAYIQIEEISATNGCNQVGDAHTSEIIELESSAIYSARYYHHEFADNGYPFDFRDLTNVPPEAWFHDVTCVASDYETAVVNGKTYGWNVVNETAFDCATIYDPAYRPTLLMPLQVRSLDPAWASCTLDLAGLYDPPLPLTTQSVLVTPTVSPHTTKQSASPGSLPTSPLPQTTASAAHTTSGSGSDPGSGSSAGGDPGSDPTKSGDSGGSSKTEDPKPSDSGNSGSGSSDPSSSGDGNAAGGGIASIIAGGTKTSSASDPTSGSDSGSGSGSNSDPSGGSDTDPSGSSDSDPSATDSDPSSTGGSDSSSNGDSSDGSGSDGNSGSGSSGSSSNSDPSSGGSSQGAAPLPSSIGGQSVAVDPSNPLGVVIGSSTFKPGQTATIGNTPVAVGTGAIVVGSGDKDPQGSSADPTTIAIPSAGASSGAAVQLGDTTITASNVGSGEIAVGSTTLSEGQVATISGSRVSASSGHLVIGSEQSGSSSTYQLLDMGAIASAIAGSKGDVEASGDATTTEVKAGVLTVGDQTITATETGSVFAIGSVTLTKGGATVINSHTVSADQSDLVVDRTKTITFSKTASASHHSSTTTNVPSSTDANGVDATSSTASSGAKSTLWWPSQLLATLVIIATLAII